MEKSKSVFKIVGIIMLLAGLSVFLIRLHHPGPYAMPQKGNLLAALLSLGVGGYLLHSWFGENKFSLISSYIVLMASPVVLFFSLYSIFAEVEETVSLRANNSDGKLVDLRLWIVDSDGAAWVTMGEDKAMEHGLANAKVELLRHGRFECVQTTQHVERQLVEKAHQLRHEKYLTQRLATVIGLFGEKPGANTVTLKLSPCTT